MRIRVHNPALYYSQYCLPHSISGSQKTCRLFRTGRYLAVAAGVAGLAGARVVVDPVHAGRLVQARALRALVNVVLAIRP